MKGNIDPYYAVYRSGVEGRSFSSCNNGKTRSLGRRRQTQPCFPQRDMRREILRAGFPKERHFRLFFSATRLDGWTSRISDDCETAGTLECRPQDSGRSDVVLYLARPPTTRCGCIWKPSIAANGCWEAKYHSLTRP